MGCFGYNVYKHVKAQRLNRAWHDGLLLSKSGQKGSEMGELYYNENRKEDESIKVSVDTTKKVTYGQYNIKWNFIVNIQSVVVIV